MGIHDKTHHLHPVKLFFSLLSFPKRPPASNWPPAIPDFSGLSKIVQGRPNQVVV